MKGKKLDFKKRFSDKYLYQKKTIDIINTLFDFELSNIQIKVLSVIGIGINNKSEISKRLSIKQSNLSKVYRDMLDKGFIYYDDNKNMQLKSGLLAGNDMQSMNIVLLFEEKE